MKIRSIIPNGTKAPSTRRRSLNSTLARPSDHRPCPLSIQWVSIWHPHTVSRPCTEEVDTFTQWPALRGVIVFEAHIPIPCTGILCLSSTSILPWPEVHFPYQIFKRREARDWDPGSIWGCFWTFCVLGSDSTTTEQAIPIFKGALPCVLGTERVGYVFVYRPDTDLW